MDTDDEHLPQGWEDDQRMSYLFSDFRESRDVNPHDWDNKLSFWQSAITLRCRHQRRAVIESEAMAGQFKRKGRVPVAVNRVLFEMARCGQLVRQSDFESSMTSGWISWGINQVVYRPVGWAYGAVFKRNQQSLQGPFIVMEVLKEIADSILETYHQSVDESSYNLVDYPSLRERCCSACNHDNTFRLALLLLRKNKKITVATDDVPIEQQVIKFIGKNQTRVSAITEMEIGILRLQKTMASLKKQIEQHESDVERLDQETRQCLRKGQKATAKSTLRKKKLAMKSVERKEATLDTLQQMIDRIHNAETDHMTMEAYKSGVSALKETLAGHNLSQEAVEETMGEVQEVLEICSEIDETFSQGYRDIEDTILLDTGGLDTEDLEAELADLLSNDEPAHQSAVKGATRDVIANPSTLADLPAVPLTKPIASQEENVPVATKPTPLTS